MPVVWCVAQSASSSARCTSLNPIYIYIPCTATATRISISVRGARSRLTQIFVRCMSENQPSPYFATSPFASFASCDYVCWWWPFWRRTATYKKNTHTPHTKRILSFSSLIATVTHTHFARCICTPKCAQTSALKTREKKTRTHCTDKLTCFFRHQWVRRV